MTAASPDSIVPWPIMFAPPTLFRDIRELDGAQATTAYGSLRDVPGDVDILIAGTHPLTLTLTLT